MKEQVRRRYNFVLKNVPTREEILIKNFFGDENEFGRPNYVLSDIDMITLDYKDEQDLSADIQDVIGSNVEHPKFYIKYKEDRKERYLKIAYRDLNILKQYASISRTNIKEGEVYRKFYKHFMSNIDKGRFYRYMTENNFLNERLQKLLKEYLYEDKIYREQEIYDHLKNYRVIRDYIFGMFEYNKTVNLDSAKINFDSIKLKEAPKLEVKQKEPEPVRLSTEDPFLNSLTDRDEISRYYDLDQLASLEPDVPVFDGMFKPKTKVLKK
ncbi:MAG: hypothetical protein PHI05_03640 [Bacilli bacterium]|nr:hypothetical protein [Bacilli bacterium]MDD4547813.1 hypothetical protein [Bacilli bacterium]